MSVEIGWPISFSFGVIVREVELVRESMQSTLELPWLVREFVWLVREFGWLTLDFVCSVRDIEMWACDFRA